MRAGIRQRLITEIPEIGGRVLESHEDGAAQDKPYVVLVQGAEAGINDWTGYGRSYEVWPYQSAASGFEAVDRLAGEIVRALDGQTLTDPSTGEVFTCKYEGTAGSDQADESRDALTRGLKFSVAAVEPAELADGQPGDAWVEAIAAWTRTLLGSGWNVYAGKWPSGYEAPAVMWRIVGLESADGNAAAVKLRKQLTGHVLGATPNGQTNAVVQIAEALKRSGKIPLDEESKQYVTVQECAAMTESDALRYGQLSVTLMRRTKRQAVGEDDAPLMREVHFQQRVSR